MQKNFTSALLDAHAPLPASVIAHNCAHPLKRFNVYRNNVVVSLVDALCKQFPICLRLTGDAFFRAMARAFVMQSPPRSVLICFYGEDFPAFVENFPPAQAVPYLADVARLEYLMTLSYHAADAVPARAHSLSSLPADRLGELVFRFHPAMHLLRSPFAIFSLWRTNTFDQQVVSVDAHIAEDVLITRPQLEVYVRALPAGAAIFIHALVQGNPLQQATEAALHNVPDFDLRENLAGLLEAGAILDFHLPSSPSLT